MTSTNIYRTVIVDDEPLAIRNLRMGLFDIPEVDVVGDCQSKEEAIDMINLLQPDVVLLDINLLTTSGFDLLDELTFKEFQVIFVTAYDNYALKAFEYNAVDYILKPVTASKLKRAFQRLQPLSNDIDTSMLQQLQQFLNEKKLGPANQKIGLQSSRGLVFKSYDEIKYIRAHGNYSMFYFTDESQQIASKTLKELSADIKDGNFFRIHHNSIVNCDLIDRYNHRTGQINLTTGEIFTVSYRKRAPFRSYLRSGHINS